MVLLAAALGAVTSLLFAGRVVARLGAPNAVAAAGALMGAMLGLFLLLPGLWALLPAALVFGACMSLFDVSINSEGSELESLSGRALMSNLHGMFSVGGMAGAALASVLLRAGLAPAVQLAAVAAGLVALMGLASRGMLATHSGADGNEEKAHFAWPNKRGSVSLFILIPIFY